MFPFNLPNTLTAIRVLLVPVLVVALLNGSSAGDVLAAIVFALASLTDFVDGYLARSQNKVTDFGKLMDPVADKLLIIAALLSLVSLHKIMVWVAMVIITREIVITVLRSYAAQNGVIVPAGSLGKAKTVFQIAAIFCIILIPAQPVWVLALLYLAVALTIISGLDYFFGIRSKLQAKNTFPN